jgi:hypothetical protein
MGNSRGIRCHPLRCRTLPVIRHTRVSTRAVAVAVTAVVVSLSSTMSSRESNSGYSQRPRQGYQRFRLAEPTTSATSTTSTAPWRRQSSIHATGFRPCLTEPSDDLSSDHPNVFWDGQSHAGRHGRSNVLWNVYTHDSGAKPTVLYSALSYESWGSRSKCDRSDAIENDEYGYAFPIEFYRRW